jgi:hypothetical protein
MDWNNYSLAGVADLAKVKAVVDNVSTTINQGK